MDHETNNVTGDEAVESGRLSEQDYWNAQYVTGPAADPLPRRPSALRRLLTPVIGQQHAAQLVGGGYAQTVVNDIVKRYLPKNSAWSIIEIGSAPGFNLLRFHEEFGYNPFGVEYAPDGVSVNRQLFRHHGLDPDQVIHADFLSDQFLETYRERFNVVCSYGFIEHFVDARDVVRRHVALTQEGGKVIIQIPNLRGLNAALTRFFHPDLLAIHNRDLMDATTFTSLFAGVPLRQQYCGYVGLFSSNILTTKPDSWKRHLLIAGRRALQLLDLGWLLLLRRWRPESRWTSPYLLYVGTKVRENGTTDPKHATATDA